jgi:hypothetical protein
MTCGDTDASKGVAIAGRTADRRARIASRVLKNAKRFQNTLLRARARARARS